MDEKEIVYIPYGLDEINQLEFLNAAANDVQSYVNSRAWSRKRKEAFLNAYLDIMSKGVTGASNESGIWKINHKGDPIDLDSKSKTDREMYQAAAYYILQKMMGVTPKTKTEKKEELTPFDNETLFKTYLMNNYYGGSKDLDIASLWDYLDPRDSTGKRGTSERRKRMIEILTGYRDSIGNGENYSFENTPFKDVTDFRNRINNAITALSTDDENDDIDAFNRLGLNSRQWFSNGLGDPSGQTLNGQELTYNQLNQYNQELAKKKAEEEAALLKAKNEAAKLAAYKNATFFRTVKANFPGTTAELLKEKYGDLNQLIAALNLYSQFNIQDLSSDLKRELFGAMKLALNNVSDDIYKKLISTPTYKGSARNRFKSISGVDNYIYDTKTGNVIQILNRELFENGNTPTSDLFSGVKTLLESLNENKNITIGENNGLTDDMKADLAAMGLDLVSAGSAFAPGYGTLASAITGIGATLTGAYADRARGESWGSTLGTAGFGLSMDILGLIPGAGVGAKAAKIAKVVAKGAKWLGPALGGLAAMSYGPGALSAYKKFISGKKDDITAEELRDFTYAIRAIAAGGIRKAGATYLGNRTLARAVKEGKAEISSGKQAASITTKNGLKINLTDDEFKTLKSNANRETKAKTITQAALREKINMKGDEIEWKGVNPVKGRFKTSSKSSKLSGLLEGTESNRIKWNTTSNDYKGIRRFSNENLLRGFTTMSASNSGLWKSIKDRWTGQDILNRPQNSNISVKESLQKLLPFIKNEYNSPKTESLRIIPISRALPQPGGTHKGNVIDNSRTGIINSNRITLGDANLEFNDFHRMYIASTRKNSKIPSKTFGNGYGTSKEPENGSLSFNGITATLTKLDNNRGFSITFGKSNDTAIAKQYKNILQLRSNFAELLNKVIKKQNNVKETAALLRQFKAKGWLKQGGTIDKQKIQRYKEFIKK